MRRVVITGLGVIAPNGIGKDEVWKNSVEGKNCIDQITKFDTEKFPVKMAGEIRNFVDTDFIPARQAHKFDSFTKYAVAASELALQDSKIDLNKVDKHRFGTYIGNCFGGWTFNDPELRGLVTKGIDEFSPFVGTAWFPAAPQGEITIKNRLKGHSKTFDSGRASGLTAIGYGARAIAEGKVDIILAGATEAMLTPFTFAALCTEGVEEPAHRISGTGIYQAFDRKRNGWVPGEGAAILLLEEYEHAKNRNAKIYGEIKGFSDITGACHPRFLATDELGLDYTISEALDDAELDEYNIDLIMADGLGTKQGDLSEYQAIKKSMSNVYSKIPVTVPKTMTGSLYGAAGALDAFWATMSIESNIALPTINGKEPDPIFDLNLVDKTRKDLEINNVLINGRGNGGICVSLVIGSVSNSK
jgi:3-oxoacyl-[acyl-carrier-protein] synthase II